MKPDIWMPLYWGDLLADTLHLSRGQFGAYVLLIGAYWRTGKPLPDNDAWLRNVARYDVRDWVRDKSVLASFFTVENGAWTHKRVERELLEARQNQDSQRHRTRAASAARWKKPSVTESVTHSVTLSPSPSPSPLSTLSLSKEDSSIASPNMRPDAVWPSWDEVRFHAEKIGLPEWKARRWFNLMEGCGWLDGQHRPIVKWQNTLTNVKIYWEADGRPPETAHAAGASPEDDAKALVKKALENLKQTEARNSL
jgi:uncharacterized protein YdaU (DUF1376 family)